MSRLKKTRDKAHIRSCTDEFGSLLRKSTDLLRDLVKNDAGPKATRVAVVALEKERGLMQEADHDRHVPLQNIAYGLLESLEVTMKWTFNRHQRRSDKYVTERNRPRRTNAAKQTCSYTNSRESESSSEDDSDESEEDGISDETDVMEDEEITNKFDKNVSKRHFKCKECGRTFMRRCDLNNHSKIHVKVQDDPAKPFKCQICGKGFSQAGNRDLHHNLHFHSRCSLPYPCDECGKKFRTPGLLDRHRKFHSADFDPASHSYKCDVCGKFIAKGKFGMRMHKLSHLDINDPEQAEIKKAFKCDVCGGRFTRPNHLKIHMALHTKDPNARKHLACKFCDKKFYQTGHMRQHEKTHEPDYDASQHRSRCSICGKDFSGGTALKYHMLTHEESEEKQRPFKCAECPRRFRAPLHLKNHRKRVHRKEPRPPIKCEHCGKEFAKKSDRRRHIYSQHIEGAEAKRPFECPDCGDRFSRITRLRDHRKEMHQVMPSPFPCPTCGKEYKHQYLLTNHQMTHLKNIADRRPIKCDDCGKRFNHVSNLTVHRNAKHPEASSTDNSSSTRKKGYRAGKKESRPWSDDDESEDATEISESDEEI